MATIYELQRKRSNYYNLVDNIDGIVKRLNESIDSITIVSDKFKNFYNIDSNSADGNKIANCKNDMIERRNKLKNVIIPAIYQKIYSINNEIKEEQSKLT